MWRVNYHFGRCKSAIGITGGRVTNHRVCPIWRLTHSRSRMMIQLK
ncbi:hypothetical protein Goshw_025803 [Gossypium schwendimanii]|uniref:Uncharacterized protein n=1 Tax=Gossypium schwendimanii TaxID=34291 RepID=A0A7J9N3B3_GOSSC|nr:hypothetical protein [Gossypium schwendimanii]